jgi:hypothetical protein
MNGKNDSKGEQWIFESTGDKGRVREWATFSRQVGDEHPILSVPIIDVDLQMFAGNAKFKVEIQIQTEERRDVKMFRRRETEAAAVLQTTQHIGFLFVKSVGHLSHRTDGLIFRIETIVEADRIEDVTDDPGKGEEFDSSDGARIHAVFPKNLEDVFFHVGPVLNDVVGIEEGKQIESVPAEKSELGTQIIDLIEVQPKVKNSVAEPMHPRHQPMMQHSAFIES